MAKIDRYQGNLQAFASGATGQERIVFGQPSSAPTQSDDLTENINAAFTRGWGTVPLGDKPPREWFNSAAWVATQLSAYLHQVGVAEWDDEQEYHAGSIVNVGGQLYLSIQDDNIGNSVSDIAFWSAIPSSMAADETYLIPSQFSTLQGAIDTLSSYKITGAYTIDLVIESGHQPASGVDVSNVDLSSYTISSQDTEVTLSNSFPDTEHFINCTNGTAPTLNCLVDANGNCNFGYSLFSNSRGIVNPGCGVKNVAGRGLYVNNGSTCLADGSIFTGAGSINSVGLNRSAWVRGGSELVAQDADFSGATGVGVYVSRAGTVHAMDVTIENTGSIAVWVHRASRFTAHSAVTGVSISANTDEPVVRVTRGSSCAINADAGGGGVSINQNGTGDGVEVNNSFCDVTEAVIQGNGTGDNGIVVSGAGCCRASLSTVSDFQDNFACRSGELDASSAVSLNASGNGVIARRGRINFASGSSTGSGSNDLAVSNGGYITADNCSTTNSSGTPALGDTNLVNGFNFSDNGNRGFIFA